MKEEYWSCIIGPVKRENLPFGADGPIRQAAKKGFKEITGHSDKHCWSGWGLSEKRKELILKLLAMAEEDLPNTINK